MWNLGYCATDFNGHGGGMHDAVLTLTGSCGFLLSEMAVPYTSARLLPCMTQLVPQLK